MWRPQLTPPQAPTTTCTDTRPAYAFSPACQGHTTTTSATPAPFATSWPRPCWPSHLWPPWLGHTRARRLVSRLSRPLCIRAGSVPLTTPKLCNRAAVPGKAWAYGLSWRFRHEVGGVPLVGPLLIHTFLIHMGAMSLVPCSALVTVSSSLQPYGRVHASTYDLNTCDKDQERQTSGACYSRSILSVIYCQLFTVVCCHPMLTVC